MLDQLKILLTRKPEAASFTAEIIATFLREIPSDNMVSLYGCGSIGKELAINHRELLDVLKVRFIQTGPSEMDSFHGFQVLSPSKILKESSGLIILLSDLYGTQMRACLSGFAGTVIGLKELIKSQDIRDILDGFRETVEPQIISLAQDILAKSSGKPILAYISEYPFLHSFKVMQQIRKMGYFVLLCVEKGDITSDIHVNDYAGTESFDFLYKTEKVFSFEVVDLLKRLPVKLVHAEAGMWTAHGLSIIVEQIKHPVVVDYRDIFESIYDTDEDAKKFMGLSDEDFNLEVSSRKNIFISATGVLYKEDHFALKLMEKIYDHEPCFSLQYLPYMSKKLMHDNGAPMRNEEKGIVYAGNFTVDQEARTYPMFQSLLKAVEIITTQGIHFSLYNSLDSNGEGFHELIKLDEKNAFFHYHFALPYEQMISKLAQYEYGWFCFDFSVTNESKVHDETTMASKIFSYYEAGLPILYSPELKFVESVVSEMGTGIPCPFEELYNLKNFLAGIDRGKIVRNSKQMRYKWTHEYNVHKLSCFYENVMKYSSKF